MLVRCYANLTLPQVSQLQQLCIIRPALFAIQLAISSITRTFGGLRVAQELRRGWDKAHRLYQTSFVS